MKVVLCFEKAWTLIITDTSAEDIFDYQWTFAGFEGY